MVFLVPIITFYGLLLVSLCAGLVDFAGSFISRRRHRWILVASLLAVLIGSWVGLPGFIGNGARSELVRGCGTGTDRLGRGEFGSLVFAKSVKELIAIA